MAHARIPGEEYSHLAADFNPVLWDPDAVALLAKQAGMSFVVLTAKHHDGFCLFHSKQTGFNVVDATPYGRDIVHHLAVACRAAGLEFGVYFSTIDWHFACGTGIDYDCDGSVRNDNLIPAAHADFNVAQLTELLTEYGPISQVWFDMGHPTPEQSRIFADTVHRLQPNAQVSGRVFNRCGDFDVMGDNEIPEFGLEGPWQSPASMFDETWGYRSWQLRGSVQAKAAEHIAKLSKVASRGGSYLLNIGPRGDGSLVEFECEVLRTIGDWLSRNANSLSETSCQPFRTLDWGAATLRGAEMFLIVTSLPENQTLLLPGLLSEIKTITAFEPERIAVRRWSRSGEDTIIEVEGASKLPFVLQLRFDEPPIVNLPSLGPDEDDLIILTVADADHILTYNHAGYYDPAVIQRLSWNVRAHTARSWSVSGIFSRFLAGCLPKLKVGDAESFPHPSTGQQQALEVAFDQISLPDQTVRIDYLPDPGAELIELVLTSLP